MKLIISVFIVFFLPLTAQKTSALDSLQLQSISDFMVDDYGNYYLYNNKNFSYTKMDSLGKELGRLMLTQPFQIQEVQNPLNIPLFSQNAQSIMLVDAHLTEIQKINLSTKFGFISQAYVEDLQQAWLLDEASNRLMQYFYRTDKIINSFPINFSLSNIKSFIVFNQKMYVLRENSFEVYHINGQKLFSVSINGGKRLLRENNTIYLLCKKELWIYKDSQSLKSIWKNENCDGLTKNSNYIFAIQKNKIYIYPFKLIN